MRIPRWFLTVLAVVLCAASGIAQQPQHLFFRVTLGPQFTAPTSGRMLIFVTAGSGAEKVDENPFSPTSVYVAAKEVPNLAPGASVDVDTDDIAFPEGFSSLKPGDYQAQAVLDVGHTYAYAGRAVGDLVSEVLPLAAFHPGTGPEPVLVLNTIVPEGPAPQLAPEFVAHAHLEDLTSPALTAFFARPVHVRAWVVLPPDYDEHAKAHYPTVYWTHGFGGNLDYAEMFGSSIYQRMVRGLMPPMIWVMLDESWATGTHEFADSANNGPWGTALTTEFIPSLEKKYRMDARPSGRFLQGHSSGGWATLQLQINYPEIFGGTWSTSPDPSDFPRLHRHRSVCAACQHVSPRRRHAVSACPRPRQSIEHDGAVCAMTRRCWAHMAGSLRRLTGCFRRAAAMGGRCPCSIARQATLTRRWWPTGTTTTTWRIL